MGQDGKEERVAAVLAGMKTMREQAIDRGMFIISAENFAVVTGFRRAGSADNGQTLTFVPRLMSAGSGLLGNPNETGPQAPPPTGEKKY